MLDDLKLIATTDKHDALGAAEKQPAQLAWSDYDLPLDKLNQASIDRIVVGAMGGSAWSADFVRSWLSDRLPIPVEIVRSYTLPAHVHERTLFIALSNSGNTEETLQAIEQAAAQKAAILAIAAGGRLIDLAREKDYAFVQTPGGHEPRFAVFYAVRVLADLFDQLKLVQGSAAELAAAQAFAQNAVQAWLPDVPTARNPAKQLAREMAGRTIVVYSSSALAAVAYRWKMQFNENAKQVAFRGTYPEFSHNEFTGWTGQPIEKPFGLIEVHSSFDHPRIQKRFELTARLASGLMPAPEVVEAQGKTELEQRLWMVLFGDFVSLYLAMLNNIDPMPVPYVDKLKAALRNS